MDRAVLAERAEHAHRAVVASRPGVRETSARQVPLEDRRAHVADRLLPGRAPPARAAVGDERAHDVIAGLHAGDARADFLDDAGAFVAEHHRQPRLEVAVRDVDVGVTKTGMGVTDEDLTGLRPVEVELLDLDRLARLVDNCGFGLHVALPLDTWPGRNRPSPRSSRRDTDMSSKCPVSRSHGRSHSRSR